MNIRYIIFTCIIFIGNNTLEVGAQDAHSSQVSVKAKLESFVVNMNNFNRQLPQEKVYLHLDNTGYFMGETIWFKAYVVRADTGCPSDMSGVLYVDLVDPSGEVMGTAKLKLTDGCAAGWIKLEGLLNSGFYEIRAYTRYMTNWDSGGIFSRVIPILNTPKIEGDYTSRTMDVFSYEKRLPNNRNEQITEEEKKMNVTFYPEGGHLVQGIENRVAFAITDENGAHFESSGWLEDNGTRIAEVSTLREGRGVFRCTPGRNRLTLHLLNKKGNEKSFRLPRAEIFGISLIAKETEDRRFCITIGRSASYASAPLGVVAMHNGNVMQFETAGEQPVFFNSQHLGDGVNQIAIIDTLGNVLAERLIFVYPRRAPVSINFEMENDYIEPYGKISMNVQTAPLSVFSLSVRDYDTQVQGWQGDAWSWMLLTSDLKGYIENPRYYMEADDEEHRCATDLLMMVQGWSRYDMSLMTKGTLHNLETPVEKHLRLDGRIYNTKGRYKAPLDNVDLFVTRNRNRIDKTLHQCMYHTESGGFFHLDSLDFYGTSDIIFRPEKKGELVPYDFAFFRYFTVKTRHLYKAETLPIQIDTPYVWSGWKADSVISSLAGVSHMLEMVEVKGKRQSMPMSAYWSNERYGAKSASIYYDCRAESDRLRELRIPQPDFLKWLEQKNRNFSGAWGSNFQENPKEQFRRSSTQSLIQTRDGVDYKRRPVIWIVNNGFYCLTFAPREITSKDLPFSARSWGDFPATLDEVNSVYISEDEQAWQKYFPLYKLEAYKPVTVFIYSRKENQTDRWERMRDGIRAIRFQGFQQIHKFESPNYKIKPALPDHRRTLYWNPDVYTDSEGNARVEFYNNTTCRLITVSAEGITPDGQILLY